MNQNSIKRRVIVIGGGASGMMAAITAASSGCEVTLLEQNHKLGKKIYATGNGKCNLTNLVTHPDDYRGEQPEFAKRVLAKIGVSDTLGLFSEMGLLTKTRDSYVYPHSEQAQSVVQTLECELKRYHVQVHLLSKVTRLEKIGERFFVTVTHFPEVDKTKQKKTEKQQVPKGEETIYQADAVILATGGIAGQNLGTGEMGYRFCEAFGHHMVPTAPALVPLELENCFFQKASGTRLDAKVTLSVSEKTYREQGEVILTDYGISGIPIMQLSRYVSKASDGNPCYLSLDFFPEMNSFLVEQVLLECFFGDGAKTRTAFEALCGLLPDKLLRLLLMQSGMDETMPACTVSKSRIKKLLRLFTALTVRVTGTKDFSKAQVTAGGIDVSEIHPETMESKKVPGLYLTGELLDIDGTCGGYNLQWAWSTGILAGRSVKDRFR